MLNININFFFPLKNLVGVEKNNKKSSKGIEHRSNFKKKTYQI